MGINLGTFNIEGYNGGTQALRIAGGVDAFTIDTTGRTKYPNQIGFVAGVLSDIGWKDQTPGWNLQNLFSNTSYNKGGGYSASRFTAPVAGAYLFHFTVYMIKNADGADPNNGVGQYVYPMFWINSGAYQSAYRVRGFSLTGGHTFGTEVVDIYNLNAGDFVEVYLYATDKVLASYPFYSLFSGMLVG